MQQPKILVIGSTNRDMVVKTKRLPQPGETVTNGEFYIAAGGKGANQAVAAARAGAAVTFVGCVGDDTFGSSAIQSLKNEGINIDFLKIQHETPSGVALILVDENGRNLISVAPGANKQLLAEDVIKIISEIETSQFMLLQLEIPLHTINKCVELAFQANVKILLNPAPAQKIPKNTLAKVNYLTPNEHELSALIDEPVRTAQDEIDAAKKLVQLGVTNVIITKGEQGVVLVNSETVTAFPAQKVQAVDTVGAGDCFSGCLAVALSEGQSLDQAIAFAQKAASIAITKKGAQPSLPYRKEIY